MTAASSTAQAKRDRALSNPARLAGVPASVSRDIQALIDFDRLPDSAFVRVHTVAGLFGVSKQCVYQWVREGRWPKQLRIGAHCSVWSVGSVRAARAALIRQAA